MQDDEVVAPRGVMSLLALNGGMSPVVARHPDHPPLWFETNWAGLIIATPTLRSRRAVKRRMPPRVLPDYFGFGMERHRQILAARRSGISG